ncbi:hypothetical protein OK016_00145 [Vibrio chagasii]|nr:hypothetical protein [Vibrio chagasii]
MTVTLSNGATITIADGATSGTTTGSSKQMMYVAAIRLMTITDATGGNFESLVKDPTAATTTINDDSDVTTGASCHGCVSHRRREHHLHGDTDESCGMAR